MMTYDLLMGIGSTIFVMGMISWMITYQLCVIYFRRHKKDIAHIFYIRTKNITIKNWTVMTYILLLLQWQVDPCRQIRTTKLGIF